MLTLKQFTELKEVLDKLDIYYVEGSYYDNTPNGELICGHWLEIKEVLLETSELSQEDLKYNNN